MSMNAALVPADGEPPESDDWGMLAGVEGSIHTSVTDIPLTPAGHTAASAAHAVKVRQSRMKFKKKKEILLIA
jgi:hypothetical protein